MPFAHWLVSTARPGLLVELGTHTGVSYSAFCEAVRRGALPTRACAVDSWTGDAHAGFYGDEVLEDFRAFHDARYAAFSTLLRLTFDEAVARFDDGSIDLLHIDGLHTHDAVSHDWRTWLPKLSARAVVLLHDTNEHQPGFGVWRLWRELSQQHPSFEFVHGHGLGVLCVGAQAPAAVRALAETREPAVLAAVRDRFAALGERHIAVRRQEELAEARQALAQSLEAARAQLRATQDDARAAAEQAAAQAGRDAAAAAARLEALRAALTEATQAQVAAAEQRAAAAEAEAAAQRAEAARAAALIDAMELERRRMLRGQEAMARDLVRACESAEDARLQRAAAEARIAAALHDRDVVLGSTSWRLLRPLRQAAAALPPGGRRALRRALRAGWWVATPWRMPARLALRRAAQAPAAEPALPVPTSGPSVAEYAAWIAAYDTPAEHVAVDIRARLRRLPAQPVISILMPVHDPDPRFLHAAIVSLRDQIYQHWELCIADDASANEAVRDVLRQQAAEDRRIRVAFRTENGHISRASNTALELATGDYIGLLDHDDLLAPHALSCIAEALAAHGDAGIVYSDEDKIDAQGRRYDPYFKPDWNYDLFLSQNMISHFAVYRADLVRELGGLRAGFEGSQDHDLALRCVERLRPGQIVHVPRVLYHWRAHAASTAQSGDNKPYARLAGQAAVAEHLRRSGIDATVELPEIGPYRVRYTLPDPAPLVSIVIPVRNGLDLTRSCIASLRDRTTYPRREIVLVDNGSDDPAMLDWLTELERTVPHLRVLRDDRPFNYSALNNAGVALAQGEVIALLNNDIEVLTPDWLEEMVGIALQPGVGAVGARLWYPDDTLQHAGVLLGVGGVANHAFKGLRRGDPGYFGRAVLTQGYSAVTAACLVLQRRHYAAVGGFDETLAVAFNDVDFCLRLRAAGLRTVWTPYAEMVHHESASRGGDEATAEKRQRFQREIALMHERWDDILQFDPAYSPNLTLKATDFTLAWPPRLRPAFQPQ